MNDWSRLAVDPKTMQKLGAENELHDLQTDSPRHRMRPNGEATATKATLGRVARGQLRLSLTNTYHEWPVNAEALELSNSATVV